MVPPVIRFGSDSANYGEFSLTAKDPNNLLQGTINFELIGSNAKNYKLNQTSYTFDIT